MCSRYIKNDVANYIYRKDSCYITIRVKCGNGLWYNLKSHNTKNFKIASNII